MNSSGKVLTVFLVIIAILLVSLTAISLFFFQKEIERRKTVEMSLSEAQAKLTQLTEELEQLKNQAFVLEQKNKEADERVNDLADELALEKGLRDEVKLENNSLKEKLDKEIKTKGDLQVKFDREAKASQDRIKELEAKLETEMAKKSEIEQQLWDLQKKNAEFEKNIEELKTGINKSDAMTPMELPVSPGEAPVTIQAPSSESPKPDEKSPSSSKSLDVELAPIVVMPDQGSLGMVGVTQDKKGRVLSVDSDVEFIIVSLGNKQGIKTGDVMSVYRSNKLLGDIRITRVEPEMSAADLMAPFSISDVRRDDEVMPKK